MQNTHAEVIIPRALAHDLKVLLMALEDYWYKRKDEAKLDRMQRLASELVVAEKLYSRAVTEQDHARLHDLIPMP